MRRDFVTLRMLDTTVGQKPQSTKTSKAGSLQPSSFEQALEVCTSRDIQALPLVVELSWNDSQKQDIRKLITSVIGHDGYDLLTLYNRAPALKLMLVDLCWVRDIQQKHM